MSEHDFTELYEQYPNVIAQMPETFTSHEFILRLAHQNQPAYVEALYSYRGSIHRGVPTPFRAVHGVLASHLTAYPELVEKIGNTTSVDIFGDVADSAMWQKVSRD